MWTNNETTELEQLVDRHGLAEVLDAIAGICGEKAEHIRASYSDEKLGDAWDRAEIAVRNCAERSAVHNVSKYA
jgi:phosphoglycolate phosphatase-like HAD superfamily hydrolase